jgi:hypothetical protein
MAFGGDCDHKFFLAQAVGLRHVYDTLIWLIGALHTILKFAVTLWRLSSGERHQRALTFLAGVPPA